MKGKLGPEDWTSPIRTMSGARRHSLLILFLSGMTGNIQQWTWVREQLQDIPADFAFGTPVLPSVVFGRTIPTVTQASNAIADELRSANDGDVIIVSHSVGSFSALGIAHEIPDAIKSVILVNGGLSSVGRFLNRPVREFVTRPLRCLAFLHLFALVSAPAPERLKQVIADRKWLTRAILGKLVSPSAIETRERRAALLNEAGGPPVLVSLWKNRHHWREFTAYSHKIPTDALFIIGDQDPVSTQEDANTMAALLPKARIRVLKGVGHAAPLEASSVIADVVREALKS
jgi:pimeloyl-ACP methyl ester carboxylesterase